MMADLQDPWTAYHQIGLTAVQLPHRFTDPDHHLRPIRWRRDEFELEPNSADSRLDRHLWGHWVFIRTSRILTLNWRPASACTILALLLKWANSSQLTRERSWTHQRWTTCMLSSLNQSLPFVLIRITLVGTKRSTSRDKCTFNISIRLWALQMMRQGS